MFSETRARRFLTRLVALGPRPSGSYECEELATGMFLEEIAKIKNVTNIVVRLGVSSQPRSSLLLNCHFDSVPSSPGASDDAVSCSVMLEILRVLSLHDAALPYDVLFLFNGAEENILQAAHEGAGAGGREILFQISLKSTWMLDLYLSSVPYPHTTVIGHELFQSGALPAETDFRIFHDYGRLPGVDIAFVKNGYVYHNEFDRPEYITAGCIQRAGENVLAMVNAVLQSDCMRTHCVDNDRHGVFFDMLGLFTLSYSLSTSRVMNSLIVTAAVAVFFAGISKGMLSACGSSQNNAWFRFYTHSQCVDALIAHALALVGSVASSALMMAALSAMGNYLVWYGKSEALLSLYVTPAFCGGMTVHHLFARRFRQGGSKQVLTYEQCIYNCTIIWLAVLLLVLTVWNLRSSYYFSFILVFLLLRFPILWLCDRLAKRNVLATTSRIFTVHTLVVLPAYTFVIYGYIELSSLLVPILARIGPVINAEKVIYVLGTATGVTVMLLVASLVYISDRMRWVRCLALYCLMYYVVVTFTSYGIPFEYDLDRPRLRRLHMQHFTRRTCCNDVKSNTTENWLWIYPLDMRGIKDLPDYDEIKSGRPPLCNTETMYCDLPYYIPVFRSFPATHSLLSKMEDLPQAAFRTEVRILDKKVDTATSSIEYDLLFVGSDHVNLFITPISYWHLSKWSFNVSIPPSQKTYFLALNCGHFPCRWNVRLTFAKNDSTTIPSSPARLAVASQFIHGKLRYSSHLRALIGRIHADPLELRKCYLLLMGLEVRSFPKSRSQALWLLSVPPSAIRCQLQMSSGQRNGT
uniref:FXNA-like protease n=1 Tax=Trichuris muris TaxID=70415 RepID=A0A5S6Q8N2_TRIMR